MQVLRPLILLVLGVCLFAQQATQVIERRCLACHNAQARTGDLALNDRASAMRGGTKGPALQPGSPDSSRLLERGVRFVQLYCGSRASGVDGLLNWDAHKTLKPDYDRHCPILDKPTAGLIRDLEARGLLRDTLVLWTTEFGRMPTHQSGTLGRDHNPEAFTVWMLGAGVRGGSSYGATDEFGRRAATDIATIYDFHATVLHLLGLDHEKLTYYHNGIARRLTDVHGRLIKPILA